MSPGASVAVRGLTQNSWASAGATVTARAHRTRAHRTGAHRTGADRTGADRPKIDRDGTSGMRGLGGMGGFRWARHVTLVLALLLAQCGLATAHEIEASVIDLSVAGGRVTLRLETNLEARLAGIGAEHEDTSQAPGAGTYEALRREAPDVLAARITPDFATRFTVTTDAGPVPLSLGAVEVPHAPDTDLARNSIVALSGDLPPGAREVRVTMDAGFGDLILRGTGRNAAYSEYLLPGATSAAIAVEGPTKRTFLDTFVQYLGVGFEHIVPLGLDHILFVIGLFLLAPRLRPLLWQVSAFTLAHTLTLALAALDIVRVPAGVVEPLIALSIVYIAVENIAAGGWRPWRPALVFAFGLLHGLGFAAVFEAYGIPRGQFAAALVAFNIGVEIGQLAVLAVCFAAIGWFAGRSWYRARVAVPASLAIAAVGAWWAAERLGLAGLA